VPKRCEFKAVLRVQNDEGREQTVIDDTQKPGDETPPDDAARPEAHAASNGSAADAPSVDQPIAESPSVEAPEPATDAPEAEAADATAPEESDVPKGVTAKQLSTIESWMAAANAAKKDTTKPVPTGNRDWYILKVQSNREDSIRDAMQKRIRIQGLDDFFGDIIVPIEKVTEFKNGKKRVVKRKLYPGYIVVNMELNDETWFLVRETGGNGDFTGSGGKPTPMAASDIAKIIKKPEEETQEQAKIVFKFKKGDRVKINEGMFENFEGEVDGIDEQNGRVTVMINIFGRSTPVELEYWQLENL